MLTGTVAATLTGLFFVAFSLRVRDLQLSVVIRTRAAYLLALLVVIVVWSAFVLMPGQSRAALASEILIVSVIGVAYLCGWCLPRLVRLAVFSVDLVVRWIAGVAGLLLGIGAGISMLIGNGGGLYFLAFGAMLLIANEVASAWSLIVGIGKDTGAKDIMLVRTAHARRAASWVTGCRGGRIWRDARAVTGCAAGCRRWWTGGSTGPAMTPTGSSPRSRPG